MKALVTGGAGFLGRYIVEKLAARGDLVRVLSRNGAPELAASGLPIEIARGDLASIDLLERCCAGVETVFHTAAHVAMWGRRAEFYRVNVEGTANLLEAARRAGVKNFVYTSSPSVVFAGNDLIHATEDQPYPQRYSALYPQTKAIAERRVIAANGVGGLRSCSLRPHLLWGPRDNHLIPQLAKRARQGKLVVVGDGSNLVDFTYIENAADAHLAAADALARSDGAPPAGQCYFISQDEPVQLWEFVASVLARLGIEPPRRRIPYAVALAAGRSFEILHRLFPSLGEPRLTYFLAQQLGTSHYFDNSKALRDFGYRPRVSVAEGLERLTPAAVNL